jgi:hypothetical protein
MSLLLGCERRLHVYQNGTHTVVKVSGTRLSSSPPPGCNMSAASRGTPTAADASIRRSRKPHDEWDATTNSPLTFRACDGSGKGHRMGSRGTECAITSPLPQPPLEQAAQVLHQYPSSVFLASTQCTSDDARKGRRLSSSSATGTGQGSVHGLSQSPQTRLASSDVLSAAAPSTRMCASLPRCLASSTSAGLPTGDKQESGTGDGVPARDVHAGSPLLDLVSFDVSCISVSPAELRPTNSPVSSFKQAGEPREPEPGRVHSSRTNSGVVEDASTQHPLLRRSGEVSMAGRVLFQGEDDVDEDESESEVQTMKLGRARHSNIVEHGKGASLRDISRRSSPPSTLNTVSASCELLQAHTPPRAASLLQRGAAAATNSSSIIPAHPSGMGAGSGSGDMTLSCTCVQETVHSSNKHRSGASSARSNSQTSSHHQQQPAATSNASSAATVNNSALSASTPNVSSIATSENMDQGRATAKPATTGLAADDCAAAAACDEEQEKRTPPGAAAKLMPGDVEFHGATPTVAGCFEHTPTPTPRRRELLRQLLVQAVSATLHTPRTVSPTPIGAVSGAPPQTPTPHPSRCLGSNTPSWEGLVQITGFPTPVKLSPIPTKAYAMFAELTASAAEAHEAAVVGCGKAAPQPALMPCTPPEALPSPTLSSIDSEELAAAPALPSTLPAADGKEATSPLEKTETPAATHQDTTARAADSSGDNREQVPPSSSMQEWVVQQVKGRCPAGVDTSEECSLSPICARAGQTTRVWTPHSNDVSQTHFVPVSSPSGVSLSNDVTRRLGSAHSRHASRFYSLSTSAEPSRETFVHVDAYMSAQPTMFPAAQHISANEKAGSGEDTENHSRCAWDNAVDGVSSQPSPLPPSVYPPSQCTFFCRSALIPNLPLSDVAAIHKSVDPSLTGRVSPRPAVDTLNLGTPTVSMIHSPAQALNESCCSFLLPPTSTPCIHALPIPGLHCCPSVQSGKKLPQDGPRTCVRRSFQSDDSVAEKLWVRLDEGWRKTACGTTLLSPALGDENEVAGEAQGRACCGEDSCAANVSHERCYAKPRHHRSMPLMSPSFETESIPDDLGSVLVGKGSSSPRKTTGTQTSCCLPEHSSSAQLVREAKGNIKLCEQADSTFSSFANVSPLPALPQQQSTIAAKQPAGRHLSSVESIPQSSSPSWTSTAPSQRCQRFGLSSNTDGCFQSREDRGCTVNSPHSATAKSLSSTRVIDSWL